MRVDNSALQIKELVSIQHGTVFYITWTSVMKELIVCNTGNQTNDM